MSKFEFPVSIKSRPVYGTLEARPGKHHLMIADAEGAEAIIDIATPELMAASHIIYIPRGTDYADKLRALNPAQFYDCLLYTSPSPRDLSTSRMPSSA